jgi:hypothetical protein
MQGSPSYLFQELPVVSDLACTHSPSIWSHRNPKRIAVLMYCWVIELLLGFRLISILQILFKSLPSGRTINTWPPLQDSEPTQSLVISESIRILQSPDSFHVFHIRRVCMNFGRSATDGELTYFSYPSLCVSCNFSPCLSCLLWDCIANWYTKLLCFPVFLSVSNLVSEIKGRT